MASSINASTTAGVVTTADTSGVLNIQTAGTTAISIDASQAVTMAGTLGVSGRISVSATNPSIRQTVQNSYLDLCGGTTVGTDPSIQIAGSTTVSDANTVFYNSNAHLFRTSSGGTTISRFNQYGIGLSTATPSSGVGITFPATQSASTDANTLDDYEEGTWTPNLTGDGGGSGQTYTAQTGTYTKIGRVVTVNFYINLSAKGTITGSVIISNLPFTVLNTGALIAGGALALWLNLAVNHNVIGIYCNTNTTNIYFWGSTGTASAPPILTTTDIANTTRFWGSATYMTA